MTIFSRPPVALLIVLGVVALGTTAAVAEAGEPVSLATLLRDMVDAGTLARWPDPEYRCRQSSSHDRTTTSPDEPGWFGNDDNTHYLRAENHAGRTEQVMLDEEGPGALVRFWLTAGGEKRGILRIYLDNAAEPTLEFRAFDLLQGDLDLPRPLLAPHPGYSPTAGGNNLWLPIPFARHCKVTWEERSIGQRYYKIDHRTYAPGTPVRTFTLEELRAEGELVADVGRRLDAPGRFVPGSVHSLNDSIPAGGGLSLDLPAGPAAVHALSLRLDTGAAAAPERSLRSVILEMTCDGEQTIRCPASDFFGTAVGVNELRSFSRVVTHDGTMRCSWVMPYRGRARIGLLNLGKEAVGATLHATVAPWNWDERSMHFHAGWRQESGLVTPPPRDWNLVRLGGRGVYVGDTLALFNAHATWYGEGDEKIRVDGEALPSHLGTGTEDYYGYSYAPQGIVQTPFGGQVRIDEPMTQGWNVMGRTRHLDAIPFRQSLDFDFELISWRPTELTYSATAAWYAFPGGSTDFPELSAEAARPIPTLDDAQAAAQAKIRRKPGALECERLEVVRAAGDFRVFAQDMSFYAADRWSGGEHLTVMARGPGDFVEIALPAPDAAPRRILLDVTKAPDFGTLAFSVDGVPSVVAFDAWGPAVEPGGTLDLGTFTPRDGRFLLRVEVTGANEKSDGARFFFGLDCVVLEPAP